MKLSTLLIAGVFALGSAYSVADHRGHGHRAHHDCHHHKVKHKYAGEYRKHRGTYRERAVAEYGRVLSVEPVESSYVVEAS